MKNHLLLLGSIGALAIGVMQAPKAPSAGQAPQAPRTSSPKDPGAAGIGRAITLAGESLAGAAVKTPVPGAKATVVVLTSTSCPLTLKYGPTLASLEKELGPKGVSFIFVNPSSLETRSEMLGHAKQLGLKGPYIHDKGQEWVSALGAKTTTEAFLFDAKGALKYRGAVDDQYSIGASLAKPRNRRLADAAAAVLAGKDPKVPATTAPGCLIEAPQGQKAEAIPTFHGRIQHIVAKSCLSCHREGGAGPFPLETFSQVRGRARMIQSVVDQGIMPPWFAAKGVGGPWKNDISLTKAEKEDLRTWIEAGMPRGKDEDAPAMPEFASSWTIGRPDVVFQLPQPVQIPASGVMPYQNIDVPTGFTEDKWVDEIEVLPGDRRAVHHVLVFARKPRTGPLSVEDAIDEGLDEISGFFGAYVPGNSALRYPAGLAKRIPKGSVLRFQLHYTPYGSASTDQTKIGLVFAKKPPVSEVHTASVANILFTIPPGEPNHPVVGQLRVPMDVQILSYLPHMHVRGRAARYELLAGGEEKVLLDVPNYNFNWQLNYILREPLDVPAGSMLRYTAWYDNSAANPANPDPTARVRFGPQTYDEMHLGYLEYIVPGEKPGEGQGLRRRGARRPQQGAGSAGIEAAFQRLDRSQDGFITQDEAGAFWARIVDADTDKDGRVSLEEAKSFFAGRRAAPPLARQTP